MKHSESSKNIPGSIAVFGETPSVLDLSLRRVLRFKEARGSVIIVDYKGLGNVMLGGDNRGRMESRPLLWIDAGARTRLPGLLRLKRSDRFKLILFRLLNRLSSLSTPPISQGALAWAVDMGYQLSENGSVTLGTIYQTISSPISKRLFMETEPDMSELDRLIKMLNWIFQFPAVYPALESNHPIDLKEHLRHNGTVWIEIPENHLEKNEAFILSAVCDALLDEALHDFQSRFNPENRITVLHLLPDNYGKEAGVADWIAESGAFIRHISVHSLYASQKPLKVTREWRFSSEETRILCSLPLLSRKYHSWLFTQEEMAHANKHPAGHLILLNSINAENSSPLTAPTGVLSHAFPDRAIKRWDAMSKAPETKCGQFSTAMRKRMVTEKRHRNIYEQLSSEIKLRISWLDMWKNGSKDYAGADGVTLRQFNNNLDENISRLITELKTGTYRCQPLNRARIPKNSGGFRELGIPCVRDRLLQKTCLRLLEPIFDQDFSDYSFGFRTGRGCIQAVRITRAIVEKHHLRWAIISDIEKSGCVVIV